MSIQISRLNEEDQSLPAQAGIIQFFEGWEVCLLLPSDTKSPGSQVLRFRLNFTTDFLVLQLAYSTSWDFLASIEREPIPIINLLYLSIKSYCLFLQRTLTDFFFFFLNVWLCWIFVAADGLSLVAASRVYSSLQWTSHCGGFSCCGARDLGTQSFSSCGSWAQLLRSIWDLPRPGIKPVTPALASRFLTTVPPGKFLTNRLEQTFLQRRYIEDQ